MEGREKCERSSSCHFISGGIIDVDCVIDSTTTEQPGCCRGYSYKAQAKCVGLEDVIACERKDCEWVETEDPSECIMTTTTTTTTTTTAAPGCCKADSPKRQDMCDLKDTQSKCDRSSSCTWLFGDDPSLCEHPTTEAPEEP